MSQCTPNTITETFMAKMQVRKQRVREAELWF
jgi:hypothetical protein